MTVYVTPRCECGHAEGEHRSNGAGWPHPRTYGACRHCACTKYHEVQPEQKAAAA